MIMIKMPLKPISTNETHRVRKIGKTYKPSISKDYKLFSLEFFYHLKQYDNDKNIFLKKYDKKRHGISLGIFYYTPNYKNKNGEISVNSGDLDNIQKPSIDQLFKWLKLNDATVTEIRSRKLYGEKYCLVITVDTIGIDS